MNMIVSGAPVLSGKLQGTALFDAIVEGDLLEGALAFARRVVVEKLPLRRVRDIRITLPDAEAFFQFARNSVGALAKNFPAPLKCVDAVAAAVSMPFDEGLRYERELFTQLVLTPESRALRHAFFAERAATKVPGIGVGTVPRKVERVAVIGAGTLAEDLGEQITFRVPRLKDRGHDPAHVNARQFDLVGHLGAFLSRDLRGSGGDFGNRRSRRNRAEVFLDPSLGLGRIDVAGDGQGGVVGRVVLAEESRTSSSERPRCQRCEPITSAK